MVLVGLFGVFVWLIIFNDILHFLRLHTPVIPFVFIIGTICTKKKILYVILVRYKSLKVFGTSNTSAMSVYIMCV